MELSGNGGSITNSATSFNVDVTLLTPDEESTIGPGTIIEINSELIRVKAYDDTDDAESVDDCIRGILGTTAASHDDGDEIVISPNISRQQVFNAARDTIDDCWPSLYEVATEQVTTPDTKNWVNAHADAIDPVMPALVQVSDLTNDEEWGNFPVGLRDPFPPAANDKAWFFKAPGGETAHVTYKKQPTRPTKESDTLPDDTWERMLVVGAVAHLIGGEDIDKFDEDYIAQTLEMQNVQIGAGQSIERRLRSYYEYLKQNAKRRLMVEWGVPVKQNGYVIRGG